MAVTVDLIGPEPRLRKPEWLRVSLPIGQEYERVKAEVRDPRLRSYVKM